MTFHFSKMIGGRGQRVNDFDIISSLNPLHTGVAIIERSLIDEKIA